MGKYQADPRAAQTTPQKSPAAAAGQNVASKTSGSYGQSSEGNVSGKGPNKPR